MDLGNLEIKIETKSAQENIKNLDKSEVALEKQSEELTRAIASLEKQIGGMSKEMAAAVVAHKKAVDEAEKHAAAIGRMSSALDAFGKIVLTASAASFAIATKSALEFGNQMALVGTNLIGTGTNLDALNKKVLDIEYGAPQQLASALYDLVGAGIPAAEAVSMLEQASRAAAASGANLNEVNNLAIQIYGTYGDSAGNTTDIMNQLFGAVNAGKFSMEQLSVSMGNILQPAKLAGVSFKELLAAYSAASLSGMKLEAIQSGLGVALSNLAKPSQEAQKFAKEFGISLSIAEIQSKGLIPYLREITEKTGGGIDALTNLFGTIEASRTVAAITSKEYQNVNRALETIAGSAGLVDQALSQMEQDPFFMWKKTLEDIEKEAIRAVIDSIKEMSGGILDSKEEILAFVRETISGIASVVSGIISVAGALSPIVGVLGDIAKIGAVAFAIMKINDWKNAATSAFSAVEKSGKLSMLGIAAAGTAIFITLNEIARQLDETYTKQMERLVGAADQEKKFYDSIKRMRESDVAHDRQMAAEFQKTLSARMAEERVQLEKRREEVKKSGFWSPNAERQLQEDSQRRRRVIMQQLEKENQEFFTASKKKTEISKSTNDDILKSTKTSLSSLLSENKKSNTEIEKEKKRHAKEVEKEMKFEQELFDDLEKRIKSNADFYKAINAEINRYSMEVLGAADSMKSYSLETYKAGLLQEEFKKEVGGTTITLEDMIGSINGIVGALQSMGIIGENTADAIGRIVSGLPTIAKMEKELANPTMLQGLIGALNITATSFSIFKAFATTISAGTWKSAYGSLAEQLIGDLPGVTNEMVDSLRDYGIELGSIYSGLAQHFAEFVESAKILNSGDAEEWVGKFEDILDEYIKKFEEVKSIAAPIIPSPGAEPGEMPGPGSPYTPIAPIKSLNVDIKGLEEGFRTLVKKADEFGLHGSKAMLEVIRQAKILGEKGFVIQAVVEYQIDRTKIAASSLGDFLGTIGDTGAMKSELQKLIDERAAAEKKFLDEKSKLQSQFVAAGNQKEIEAQQEKINQLRVLQEKYQREGNRLAAENVSKQIDEAISGLIELQRSVDAKQKTISDEIQKLIEENKTLSTESGKSIAEKEKEISANIAEIKKNFGMLQASAMATFSGFLKSGMSTIDILAGEMSGQFADIGEMAKQAGIMINPAMQKMIDIDSFLETNKKLSTQINATKQMLSGLGSADFLDAVSLGEFGKTILGQFNQIKSATGSADYAFTIMGQSLGELKKYAEANNIPLDKNLQALIDQATELGYIKKDAPSATDVMQTGFDAVTKSVGEMGESIKGISTYFQTKFSDDIAAAIAKIAGITEREFVDAVAVVKNNGNNAVNSIKDTINKAVTSMKDGLSGFNDEFTTSIQKANELANAIKNIPPKIDIEMDRKARSARSRIVVPRMEGDIVSSPTWAGSPGNFEWAGKRSLDVNVRYDVKVDGKNIPPSIDGNKMISELRAAIKSNSGSITSLIRQEIRNR